MVKVTGPAMSLDASGKLGDSLVFSKWKGRNYIRRLVKPANPKSGAQTGVRSMMKFLSQDWTNVGASEQATWETPAEAYNISPFNAYIKEGLFRNRNFLAPSQSYPAAVADTPVEIDVFTATAGERQISIVVNLLAAQGDNWGVLLYRDLTTAFTPAFDNLIAAFITNGVTEVTYVDTPLEPDEYFYDCKPFCVDGAIGSLDGEISDTVT